MTESSSSGALTWNVLDTVRGTTVDGPGFRTAFYLAGCSHRCRGCHNPQSWNPANGTAMTLDKIMEIVREEDFDVTLTGGDPLFTPDKTKILVDALKADRRRVWLYTGFRWEQIMKDSSLVEAVRNADVVVDGPFVESLRDPDLLFRGSSNQRLIDAGASIELGKPVEWHGE